MGANEIGLGSIVTHSNKNEKLVIVGMDSREDAGSCCFDRTYYVLPLEELETKEFIGEKEGEKIKVVGTVILPFDLVEDIAPFKFTREVRYKVERKKAKIIYE